MGGVDTQTPRGAEEPGGEQGTCWLSADTRDREAAPSQALGQRSGVACLLSQVQISRWLLVAQRLGPFAIFSAKGSESHAPCPGVSGLEEACSAACRRYLGQPEGWGCGACSCPPTEETQLVAWA